MFKYLFRNDVSRITDIDFRTNVSGNERLRSCLQDQKIKFTSMFEVACGNFCVGPVSPEQIGPARSSDSPTGVLIQRKAGKALPALDLSGIIDQWFFCLDESQSSWRKYAAIQRDGTPRC